MFLFTTTLFSGLVAGLLYAYSVSVNMGLKSLGNTEYIRAMQAINSAIQNPAFFISFMGLLVLFPITVYQQYSLHSDSLYLLVSGMIIYFVGVFALTITGNVPLNEQLAKFSIATSSADEISAMRKAFEEPWNKLHAIRTAASIISFGCLLFFILKQLPRS